MSFDSLMKDSGRINAFSSASEYGVNTSVYGGTFRCRFSSQAGAKVVTPSGEDALVDGFCFFDEVVTVTEKDQIEINGTLYRILSLVLVGGFGADHHYKAGVRRA